MMGGAWISLSTRWGLTSVQAAINVILSVLGTAGVWSFSRYWWQRETTAIIRKNSVIPLSRLINISSPGEAWDVVLVLGRRIFHKENWCVLFQLSVILTMALASILSGPIAKVSLRSTMTVQPQTLEVLNSVDSGPTTNLINAKVVWNETIDSLNNANFPYTQMLEFLPPSMEPWVFVDKEWNPTWSMSCEFTPVTTLTNVVGSGNGSFGDVLDAFPTFRETLDQAWFNKSEY